MAAEALGIQGAEIGGELLAAGSLILLQQRDVGAGLRDELGKGVRRKQLLSGRLVDGGGQLLPRGAEHLLRPQLGDTGRNILRREIQLGPDLPGFLHTEGQGHGSAPLDAVVICV